MRKSIYKKSMVITLTALCGCSLVGCSQTSSTGSKKDVTSCSISKTKEGTGLPQLNVEELEEKIKNKEKFVLMISTSSCTYCNSMRRTLVPYFCDRDEIPFYEIEYDMLGESVALSNAYASKIKEMIPAFSGSTPTYFYYENGIIQSQKTGEMSLIEWNNYMIESGLVKGSKIEEKTKEYKMAKSKYLKEMLPVDIMKKVKKKDDFYVLFVEENRYSAEFSKTVKKYAEENKTEFIIFNYSSTKEDATKEESDVMNKAYTEMMKVLGQVQIAPSLFHIKDGKTVGNTQDNITEEKLAEWMGKTK